MTHFSDPLRTGQAVNPQAANNGGGPNATLGGPISPLYFYDILPAATVSVSLATGQTVSGASWTLAAGSGITATTIAGSAAYAFDVPRTVLLTGAVSTVTPTNVTVVGWDTYDVPMTATFSGPTGTGTAASLKAFAAVYSVTAEGDTTSAVSIAAGNGLGMPYRVDAVDYLRMCYSGTIVTASTGFVAASSTTATAFTGDVRGTYTPQSTIDGSKRFTALIYLEDVNSKSGLYGVDQA